MHAIWIPYETWLYEELDDPPAGVIRCESLADLPKLLIPGA